AIAILRESRRRGDDGDAQCRRERKYSQRAIEAKEHFYSPSRRQASAACLRTFGAFHSWDARRRRIVRRREEKILRGCATGSLQYQSPYVRTSCHRRRADGLRLGD
ncbi:MAG: hypothetical protein WBV35_08320, partial [Steroidobacteraceae bacterium]